MNHTWMIAFFVAAFAGCHSTGMGGDPFAGRTRVDAPPTGALTGSNPYLSGTGVPGGSTLQPPTVTGPAPNTSMFAPWSGSTPNGFQPGTSAPTPRGWGWPNPWGSAPATPTVPPPAPAPNPNWNQSQPNGNWMPSFLQPSTWGTPSQPTNTFGTPAGLQNYPTWMPQPTGAAAPPPGTNYPYPGRASLAPTTNETLTSTTPSTDASALGWRNPTGGVMPASYQAPASAPTVPPVVSAPEVGGLSREAAPRIPGSPSTLPISSGGEAIGRELIRNPTPQP